MPKKVKVTNRDGLIIEDNLEISLGSVSRMALKQHYLEKFFNKFLNKFEFTGLSYQQIAFIMRQFWSYGTIGCFIREDWNVIKESPTTDEYDKIVFAPWVMSGKYNIYNFPTEVRFINTRAVAFIPTHAFGLDESACIGYIMRNKKGVITLIEAKLNQLVDIEMVFQVCLQGQKMPWFIACSPEDEAKMKQLFKRIARDENVLFGGFDDLKNVKALVSGAPYILDKLYQNKQAIENEILTLLGINNIGTLQKKEHLTTGEVEENDQQIQSSSDEFLSNLQEFFGRIKDVLDYDIQVKLKDEFLVDEEEDSQYYEEDSTNDE